MSGFRNVLMVLIAAQQALAGTRNHPAGDAKMKSINRSALATAILTALLPACVFAQATSPDTRNQGYLVDTNGNIVMTDHTGMCVRDSDWTPARAMEPCVPPRPRAAVVAPAAPAPVVAAVPPPALAAPAPAAIPLTQKASFSADALFAFDKAILKPEGMTMLDDLVRQSAGLTYESIVLTGHADRFGSSEYNQKLSERRATAVKDYLVSKNIQAARIEAVGHGEKEPVTAAGTCAGPRSAKVIACLQPDRRVDVEMTGSRGTTTGTR
jgi:OOP family OmpA-OmpF porin